MQSGDATLRPSLPAARARPGSARRASTSLRRPRGDSCASSFVLARPRRRARRRIDGAARARRAAARPRDDHGLRGGVARPRRVPDGGGRRRCPAEFRVAAARGARDGARAPPEVRAARSRAARSSASRRVIERRRRQRGRDRARHGARGGGAPARRGVLLRRGPQAAAGGPRRPTWPASRSTRASARYLDKAERMARLVDAHGPSTGCCPRREHEAARAGRARLAKADLDDADGPRVPGAAGRHGRHLPARARARAEAVARGRALALPPVVGRGGRGARGRVRRRARRPCSPRCRWPTSSTRWPATSASAWCPTGSSDPFGLRRAGAGRRARAARLLAGGRRRAPAQPARARRARRVAGYERRS